MDLTRLPTRDPSLPAAYSEAIEQLSLAPLWTALHVLLPNERTTRVVPRHWRWADPQRAALRGGQAKAAGLVPRDSRYEGTGYPQVRWPWRWVRTALAAMAETAPAAIPVVLRHVNPCTGTWPLPTMGSEAQWLRPGETTRAERRTGSGVFDVIEGRGETRIGDAQITWEQGDCFAAPPWQWIEHENRSSPPACLSHLTDEPALTALGLWREERKP